MSRVLIALPGLVLAAGLAGQYATVCAADKVESVSTVVASSVCPGGQTPGSADDGRGSGCLSGSHRVGTWQWHDPDGHVLYRLSYDDRGVLNGPASQYGPEGRVLRKFSYQDGKLEGLDTSYWPDGHLREIATYRNGKLHGVRKRWAYAPPSEIANCTRANEDCWEGSQECWIGGERKSHEACSALYADDTKTRAPASAH